jgi:hypothetical protein
MAKASYHIPESIDQSPLDIEIAIRSSAGVGLRPLPLKFILSWLCSVLMWFFITQATFVSTMGILFIVLFSIVWFLASLLLLRLDKSNSMTFTRVPILISYMPRSARHVSCRTHDSVGPFYSIANLESIDEDRGMVTFADGDVGAVYRVVGSASVLLFPEDREAILDRVDAFYRNMGPEYEIIYITAKESQNVKRQLRNMDARIARLENDDPDLKAVAEMDRYFLSEMVGKRYRSIHQYMILKAGNEEALQAAHAALESEVNYSTLMIKRCVALYDEELHDVFKTLFKGRETL